MKNRLMMSVFLFSSFLMSEAPLTVQTVQARQTHKVGIVVAGIGHDTHDLRELCKTIKTDLLFTGQFEPESIFLHKLPSEQEVLKHQDTQALMLFISDIPKAGIIEWHLYETKNAKMVAGKKMLKKGSVVRGWGHALSDAVLKEATGCEGSFSTKLVYCKEDPRHKNKTSICISDYDGTHEQVIVKLGSKGLAPRWNNDLIHPLIIYSEYTPYNVRLMVTNLQGKKEIATSFNGLNMSAAFSPDGKDAVVCLSAEGGANIYRCVYNKKRKEQDYIRLTYNEGNNISPTILSNGDIVFCSDFEFGRPQIYKMNRDGKQVRRISADGACTSPSYCAAIDKIAYSKLVDGVSQIIVHDCKTEKTKQITTDSTHKEESSWSPCGRFLTFSVDDTKAKRIAIQNIATGERHYLTKDACRYSYPVWSPRYQHFPCA